MTRHLTEEELLSGREHPHLDGCRTCQRVRQDVRTFTRTLGSARVWQNEEPALRGEAPRRPILHIAARLEEEQERARAAIASITSAPERASAILDDYPATAGLLQAATTAARALLDSNPAHGYHVTLAAEELAGRIDWEAYPGIVAAEHRGRVFRERASALRLMGRHDEALAAIARARSEYDATLASDHDLAVLDYIAASILREQGRLAEARDHVERAILVFTDFGDATRLLHCRNLEAIIAAADGRLREARQLLVELLGPASSDLPFRAQVHNNIGQLSIELGEHDLAATHLLQALSLYRELGMVTEEIRTNWGLAKLLVRNGRTSDSILRFQEAETAFLAAGMRIEAALVSLDRIETLLATQDRAGVAEECRAIHERLHSAGLTTNALTALAYLSESLSQESAAEIHRVRAYLERLQNEPALLFLPHP